MAFSSSNPSAHQAAYHSQPTRLVSDGVVIDELETHLLEQTFRMIPDVVSIYDLDSQQVIYSNRTLALMLGYDRETAPDEWLLHPDDVASMNAQFQHLLQTNDDEPVDFSYRLKHANGSWKWFSERQVIFKRDAAGNVTQVLRTTREDKEQTANHTAYYGDLLYRITEYNLPNFAFLLFDRDMRYTVATGILLRRIGFQKEQMEGYLLREVISPDIADWLEPAYQAALEGVEIHLEQVIGGIIVSVDCLPVRNENGEIIAGMVLAQDVTDEKQAMAALIESEQRFAQFSENMHALFWMLDTEQKQLLYLSPACNDILELSPELAYENPAILLDILHPDDRQLVIDTFKQTFVTGHHELKFRVILPSGNFRWLSSRAFPIYDDQDKVYRVAGIVDDITQHVEMESATFDLALEREHMRLLSQFISTTSHELRTPLTIINTSLYLIRKTNDPARQADRLQIIEHQVAQLARLVSQMHMLLRVESITDKSSVQPVSLNKMLGTMDKDYASDIAKKELQLQLVLDENIPNLNVDPELLRVVLQNVFENAINYTDVGSITVRTAAQDNQVILTVQDTGIGIDPEDLPHIFERFYKVEKNKKRTAVAAGLGLAIMRGIMELSGGRIEVETEVGHGSTFTLIWPVTV